MAHKHPANIARHDDQSRVNLAVDRFVAFFGSLRFISYMTCVIILWLLINTLSVTHAIHFDQFPFILLNLAFSAQATYAAPLILLSQNRQAEHDRIRAEEDFKTNELALSGIRNILLLLHGDADDLEDHLDETADDDGSQ